jgi:hypothetical protein
MGFPIVEESVDEKQDDKKPSLDTAALKARLGLKKRSRSKGADVGSESAIEEARTRSEEALHHEGGTADASSFGVVDDGRTPLPQKLPEPEVRGVIEFEGNRKGKWLPMAISILFVAGIAFLLGHLMASSLTNRDEVTTYVNEARAKLKHVVTEATRSGSSKVVSALEIRIHSEAVQRNISKARKAYRKQVRPLDEAIAAVDKQLATAGDGKKAALRQQKATAVKAKDAGIAKFEKTYQQQVEASWQSLRPVIQSFVTERAYLEGEALISKGGSSQPDLAAASGAFAMATRTLYQRLRSALERMKEADAIRKAEQLISKKAPKQLAISRSIQDYHLTKWMKEGLEASQATASCKSTPKEKCDACCTKFYAKTPKTNGYSGGFDPKRGGCLCVREIEKTACATKTDCPDGYECKPDGCHASIPRSELKLIVLRSSDPYPTKGLWRQNAEIEGRSKVEPWDSRALVQTKAIHGPMGILSRFLANQRTTLIRVLIQDIITTSHTVNWNGYAKRMKKWSCPPPVGKAHGAAGEPPAEADCKNAEMLPKKWKESLDNLEKCRAGQVKLCVTLAEALSKKKANFGAAAKALTLYQTACTMGDKASCKYACDAGISGSCN